MFRGRKYELDRMNTLYRKDRFECVIIYGRRRVGKTALINEFCKDKPTVFVPALDANEQDNMKVISGAISAYKYGEASPTLYTDIAIALDELTRLVQKGERLVVVIDEYPYLAAAIPSISSRIQHLIDHQWAGTRMYLILCGSSMSFMEYQVMGYKSPLYGRRTAQFRIEPLDYRETAAFASNLSVPDQALLFGVTGGVPLYINELDVNSCGNMDEALLDNFFEPSTMLFEEPGNLLKQELREPAKYNSIITAIAGGASHCNEIATKLGIESGACAKYLKVLLELGIVSKSTPVTVKTGKQTIYAIEDNFFRFWYRFVPGNIAMIATGNIRRVYDNQIKRYYSEYMGHVFERMCQSYLMSYAFDSLPVLPCEIGSWWGSDAKTKTQVEIDIVGVPAAGQPDTYIIGSCKYRNEPVDIDELELLKRYAEVFRPGGNFVYFIFSKSGFTQRLQQCAQDGEVRTVTLEELYL